jgi:hypothetical protein
VDTKELELRSYAWTVHEEEKTGKEFVVGYIRVKKDQAERFEKYDKDGVFIERLKGQDTERCRHWVEKLKEEPDKVYQAWAKEEAKKLGKPLLHRRGGGNYLCIKGAPTTCQNIGDLDACAWKGKDSQKSRACRRQDHGNRDGCLWRKDSMRTWFRYTSRQIDGDDTAV